MRLHRFIYTDIEGQSVGDTFVIKDLALIHQIKNVFRMKDGDELIVCDGNYKDYIVSIENIEKGEIEIRVEEIKNLPAPEKEIYVFISLIKPAKFDGLVPHLVEVGATKIIPIISTRTQKRNLKTERLKEIIKEATEQSGRGKVANLLTPMSFEEALIFAKKQNLKTLIFHTQKSQEPAPAKNNNVALFVGPEGGFTDEEVSLAVESGAQNVSLGENILRAETAGIVATYLVSQGKI